MRTTPLIPVSGTPDLKVHGMADLMKEYRTRFGLDFDATDATVINGIAVYRDALDRAKTTEPEKLREAIASTDLKFGTVWIPGS